MKSLPRTLLLGIFALCSLALAQERHNSLAVGEQLLDEAGPFYFIAWGDSTNAFAKAAPLAAAMGLTLSYDEASKTLVFQRGTTTARLAATADVAAGLEKRSGVLSVDGRDRPSPMGILAAGVSYVPIVPVAEVFGWDAKWHAEYRLITLQGPRSPPAAERPQGGSNAVATLGGFRVGAHEGFTRVAVDLGEAQDYSVAVREDTMMVVFHGAGPGSGEWAEEDANLLRAYWARSEQGAALVVQTKHALDSQGRGFRVGLTESNTFYVDFGPGLRGESVAQLVDGDATEPAAVAAVAPAPPELRRVVVIDAGHGGKFMGAHGYAKEEVLVLNVALKLKALLEDNGVDVILTRDGDYHLSEVYHEDLAARATFATPERNVFVSIHANAADSPAAQGIETWVFGAPLDPAHIERAIQENGRGELGRALTDEALKVANDPFTAAILRETQLNYSLRLAEAVQRQLVAATGAKDRGVKQNAFYVIRNARTPAILVELGFVSNPEEGRRLGTESYQSTLAEALAQGILQFLDSGGTVASR